MKIQHIFTLPNRKKFNELAAKGRPLYEMIKKEGDPFYIDRLTGGVKYHPYAIDKALLKEYNDILGEWFLGIQLYKSAPMQIQKIKDGTYRVTVPAAQLFF